jgi:hypothetical protein
VPIYTIIARNRNISEFIVSGRGFNVSSYLSKYWWQYAGLHYRQINKDKTIPLQAWTGPEDSRRLWVSDFKTIGT